MRLSALPIVWAFTADQVTLSSVARGTGRVRWSALPIVWAFTAYQVTSVVPQFVSFYTVRGRFVLQYKHSNKHTPWLYGCDRDHAVLTLVASDMVNRGRMERP